MDLTEKLQAFAEGDDLDTEVQPEATEVENLETENVEIEAQDEQPEAETQEAEPQAPEAEEDAPIAESQSGEFTPTLKFKVLKEEHDFPEWSHALVKDKETEEQFIDLFTKANALEHQKKRRSEVEDEFAKLQTDYDSKMGDAQQLAQIVSDHNQRIASNDPAEQLIALQNAGLSEKALLDVARHVLDLQKLSPSQRQAYQNQFQQRDQISQYEQQLNQTNENLKSAQVQAARAELSSFLATKRDIIGEYESLEDNTEGDFQDDFIQFGVALQAKLGREVEWKEAMKKFKKVHGLGKPKSKPAPKVLPNLRSTGHSPIEKGFKSLDDLKEYMNNKM